MKNKKDQQPSQEEEITNYYNLGLEAVRLSSAEGALELVRSQEIISRYMPGPPAVVLDVGGGPGAYACWLAQKGYEVHLIDPMPLHLEQARMASERQPMAQIASIAQGDSRNLNHPASFADVVLLLGPLYHLTERSDRISTLQESFRVLKQGGRLFAVGISRFASTLAGLIDGFFEDADFVSITRRDVQDGQHRNPTGKPIYFTTAFFHHPDELRGEVLEAGFAIEGILAVEGAAVFLQDLATQWNEPDRRERILEAVRWLEAEPSVMGVTGHMIAVGSKQKNGTITTSAAD
jgi:ubiquinone/menaquinone biosynthesis C-methylase UbiE